MTVPKRNGAASLGVLPEDEHEGQQPARALLSSSNCLGRLGRSLLLLFAFHWLILFLLLSSSGFL